MKFAILVRSFRARLLILLALMLGLTLGVQYYVNLRAVRANAEIIREQERAIMTGVALGIRSVQSREYLDKIAASINEPLVNDKSGRVKNILLLDDEGKVLDSIVPEYNPVEQDDKTIQYYNFTDLGLASVRSAVQFIDEEEQRPSWLPPPTNVNSGEASAFYFPVETDKGRRYILVVLGSANLMTNLLESQARRSALYTLVLLLVTTLVTAFFVWRFTRPVKELSIAARRVAGGNFEVQVPADRSDEMGTLAASFNEMTARLGRARELETQLHQAEKGAVVGRLAAAIAHEIRNPLNYINLTLDHLRSSFAPADEAKRETFVRLTDQLKSEVGRINRHITDFLKYSRPTKLDLQGVDIRAEAEDALRMVEAQVDERGIETTIVQDADLPRILADRESLRSVLTNLVINAVEAIDGEGGSIAINLSRANEDFVKVQITDTGCGIAADDIAKVFEPYFSTKDTGTGLGLAIVKKAIDDHGGTINVTSKQGTGTTFTITLPVQEKGETDEGRRQVVKEMPSPHPSSS